jgi:hypothetical protein
MPDLNSLGLNEEAAPQCDWDAPPPGMTPPSVVPGDWWLKFVMPEKEEDWFDKVKRNVIKDNPTSARDFLEVTIEPEVVADSQKRPVANEDGSPLKLGPQRFNTFMSPKMRIHRLAELLRGVGVRIEGSIVSQIADVCKQLNGQALFEAEIIWRAYFKSTDTTVSTHPRGKKSGELLWPRDAQGNWELMAVNPSTGEKAFGYAEIASIKLPTAASGQGENLASAAS